MNDAETGGGAMLKCNGATDEAVAEGSYGTLGNSRLCIRLYPLPEASGAVILH